MIKHNLTQDIDTLDIAVIGMSCRVPGADNIDQFWLNLQSGVESILPVDNSRRSYGKNNDCRF